MGAPVRSTSEVSRTCYAFLRLVGPLLVAPLCLASFVYTCVYAYIYAKENSYGPSDWRKCLVAGNLGNLHLDMNHFATSASNFAGQAYLSLLIAIGGAYLGLLDNDLLPISIYTSVVSITGILIFRESYPFFDDPHFMSTTLVTLTQYVTAHMYDDLAANSLLPEPIKAKLPSSEVCRTAYRVNVGFLCVQYGILAVACLILVLCTYALLHRPLCSPHRPPPPPLRASSLHPVLACLAFCSMLIMLVCKEVVATTAVRVAQATGHSPMYQFTDNNLDMISLTTLITIGAAVYGLCKRDCAPIKVCAGVGLLHVTRSLPGLLGTLVGYSGVQIYDFEASRTPPILQVEERFYRLWSHEQCIQYVLDTNKSSFGSDPSAHSHASVMCSALVGSISGQLATYLSILGLLLASALVVVKNRDRHHKPSSAESPSSSSITEVAGSSSSSSSSVSSSRLQGCLVWRDERLSALEDARSPLLMHGLSVTMGEADDVDDGERLFSTTACRSEESEDDDDSDSTAMLFGHGHV